MVDTTRKKVKLLDVPVETFVNTLIFTGELDVGRTPSGTPYLHPTFTLDDVLSNFGNIISKVLFDYYAKLTKMCLLGVRPTTIIKTTERKHLEFLKAFEEQLCP